jgi:hypothetical protein
VTTNSTLWGIDAGKTADAASFFSPQNAIALGWTDAGTLQNSQKTSISLSHGSEEI